MLSMYGSFVIKHPLKEEQMNWNQSNNNLFLHRISFRRIIFRRISFQTNTTTWTGFTPLKCSKVAKLQFTLWFWVVKLGKNAFNEELIDWSVFCLNKICRKCLYVVIIYMFLYRFWRALNMLIVIKSKIIIKPPLRFELRTPGLQDQCSNHWAMEASITFYINLIDFKTCD